MESSFQIAPDLEKLRPYYFRHLNDEQWEFEVNSFIDNGCFYYSPFAESEQNRTDFEREFKEILINHKNNLIHHYDNLFYICLRFYEILWMSLEEIRILNERENRMSQLAKSLLIFETTKAKDAVTISFKNLMETVNVTDPHLIKWMAKVIREAIEENKFPFALGDALSINMLNEPHEEPKKITKELLSNVAESTTLTIESVKKQEKTAIAKFCLQLFLYLQLKTELHSKKENNMSNSQLKFFIDVLLLFNMIYPGQYEPNSFRLMLKSHIGSFFN